MFIIDCQPEFVQNDLYYRTPCHFQYVAMHTNPPLTLKVSEDYLIEILNAVIDEETQLEFAKSYFALPVPLKSSIPLTDSKITPAVENAKKEKQNNTPAVKK